MACCSSRRGPAGPTLGPLVAATAPPPRAEPGEALRYIGSHELALMVPVSRVIYKLAPGRAPFAAAAPDVPALLASGLFERA